MNQIYYFKKLIGLALYHEACCLD